MSKKIIGILNLVAFAFLMVASFIFSSNENMFNVNGVKPIFMPSGYAFSIWILIYVLLFIWIIKSFFCSGKVCEMYKSTAKWFIPCLILTGVTVIVLTRISTLFISLALATAILTYITIEKSGVSKLYKIPFSFLVGWLFVATIVDILLVLKLNGWFDVLGVNEVTLAIVMLGVGVFLAIIFALGLKDNIVLLVVIWAYIAIAINNSDIKSIVIMSLGMCIIVVLAMLYNLYKMKKK
ncbi:MAG: hypothetical protein ACRC6T_09565 [Sarcina sp.]